MSSPWFKEPSSAASFSTLVGLNEIIAPDVLIDTTDSRLANAGYLTSFTESDPVFDVKVSDA